jgi:hypothetical protein
MYWKKDIKVNNFTHMSFIGALPFQFWYLFYLSFVNFPWLIIIISLSPSLPPLPLYLSTYINLKFPLVNNYYQLPPSLSSFLSYLNFFSESNVAAMSSLNMLLLSWRDANFAHDKGLSRRVGSCVLVKKNKINKNKIK